jgi:hypothetical protein
MTESHSAPRLNNAVGWHYTRVPNTPKPCRQKIPIIAPKNLAFARKIARKNLQSRSNCGS